jgi:hypothetical protein
MRGLRLQLMPCTPSDLGRTLFLSYEAPELQSTKVCMRKRGSFTGQGGVSMMHRSGSHSAEVACENAREAGPLLRPIINTLFGYIPRLGQPLNLFELRTPRGLAGKLCHVRCGSDQFTIRSDNSGLHLRNEANVRSS